MLASAETIEIVADAFRRYSVAASVVDPVCYTIANCTKEAEDP
jgi:hydroxymethylpyrimidine/phosphomethylpyrimidine kinase